MFYYIRYYKIVIYNQLGVLPNFFKDLRVRRTKKRLKNTGLDVFGNATFYNGKLVSSFVVLRPWT
jgi:hypothetical protein